MELIKSYYETIDKKIQNLKSLRFARRLVYLWIFINYLILATNASFFYSSTSLMPVIDFSKLSYFSRALNLLHWSPLVDSYPVFLFLILTSSLLCIFEVAPRINAGVTFFLMMNLDNKSSVILDGGNNLIHLIAFYLIFVAVHKNINSLSKVLTNLAHLMIKIQIVLVYATAGLLKVMGPLWSKGVALYYTLGVPEYGNQGLFNLFSNHPILLSLATLGTVLFQISFPYLIWNKNWRPYLIFIGTCFHLSISFVMGLFMFGMAMCVSYFFFYTDEESGLLSTLKNILIPKNLIKANI